MRERVDSREGSTPRGDVDGPAFGEQTVILAFDDRIALACPRFQRRAVEHDHAAAAAKDQPGLLQPYGNLGDALAAHAQHVGDQVMRERQLVGGQPVQA